MKVYVVYEEDYDYEDRVVDFFDNLVAAQYCVLEMDNRHLEEVEVKSTFESTRVHTCAEPPKHGCLTREQHERSERNRLFLEALCNMYPPTSIENMARRTGEILLTKPGCNGVFNISDE